MLCAAATLNSNESCSDRVPDHVLGTMQHTVEERGVVDMFYTVCMTPFSAAGTGRVKLRDSHIRGVTVGWIVFMFLATAAYTSNLTKILSLVSSVSFFPPLALFWRTPWRRKR